MDFKIEVSDAGALRDIAADALLLVVGEATRQAHLGKAPWTLMSSAIEAGDFAFKAGRCLVVHQPGGVKARRVVFAAASASGVKAWRAALASGLAAIKGGGAVQLAVALCDGETLTASHAQALCTAVGDSVYVYRHTKPSAAPDSKLMRVVLCAAPADESAASDGLQRGRAIAAGIALARECANRPGNHFTPTHLAAEATRLGKAHGLEVEVLNRKDVHKLGMGSFLAVAQGSSEPLKFVVLKYQGAAKSSAPVVLVGKGITFDTGGISMKPAADMDEMKFDMGGAASVLGTFRALAELKPKINVIGLIPACENMPGGDAVKPGDVVTSLSGQTIEILNTDAEGRLILCDALTYAERFKPSAVIDIATLTGACVVALGHHRSGMFSSDDALAEELERAGQRALDPCWRMPLDDEYDEALKSNFADMANVGPRAGGAITAAMFLKRFTARYPWAHLDIAGSAWKSGVAKGATGRPVGLLCEFLLSRAA
jgi:leucyl aminopeptidase